MAFLRQQETVSELRLAPPRADFQTISDTQGSALGNVHMMGHGTFRVAHF